MHSTLLNSKRVEYHYSLRANHTGVGGKGHEWLSKSIKQPPYNGEMPYFISIMQLFVKGVAVEGR